MKQILILCFVIGLAYGFILVLKKLQESSWTRRFQKQFLKTVPHNFKIVATHQLGPAHKFIHFEYDDESYHMVLSQHNDTVLKHTTIITSPPNVKGHP
jgi:hypothetical protein